MDGGDEKARSPSKSGIVLEKSDCFCRCWEGPRATASTSPGDETTAPVTSLKFEAPQVNEVFGQIVFFN